MYHLFGLREPIVWTYLVEKQILLSRSYLSSLASFNESDVLIVCRGTNSITCIIIICIRGIILTMFITSGDIYQLIFNPFCDIQKFLIGNLFWYRYFIYYSRVYEIWIIKFALTQLNCMQALCIGDCKDKLYWYLQ